MNQSSVSLIYKDNDYDYGNKSMSLVYTDQIQKASTLGALIVEDFIAMSDTI